MGLLDTFKAGLDSRFPHADNCTDLKKQVDALRTMEASLAKLKNSASVISRQQYYYVLARLKQKEATYADMSCGTPQSTVPSPDPVSGAPSTGAGVASGTGTSSLPASVSALTKSPNMLLIGGVAVIVVLGAYLILKKN